MGVCSGNREENKVKRFYWENEMAGILGLERSTLAKNRSLKKNHPPFKKLGGKVAYPIREFEIWLESVPLRRELAAG